MYIFWQTRDCRGGASCPPSRDYASHLESLYFGNKNNDRSVLLLRQPVGTHEGHPYRLIVIGLRSDLIT
jgi:hypothetical protein